VSQAATATDNARLTRTTAVAGGALYAVLVALIGLLVGYGWLYALRGPGWFHAGPSVGDSLPLLQLAGADGQPLLRVVVAWLLAGLIAGVALSGQRRWRRVAVVGPTSLVAALLASQAAYALARNLRFSDVAFSRRPGLGPILEALVFTAGCALIPRLSRGDGGSAWRRNRTVMLDGVGEPHLSGGEHRDASEDDRDREPVDDERRRTRA
jgi:hypothetical protein